MVGLSKKFKIDRKIGKSKKVTKFMLSEEEKDYFHGLIKAYRLFGKVTLSFLIFPVLSLIYFCVYKEPTSNDVFSIIISLILFMATYSGGMSFYYKADIFNDIVNKPGFGEEVKTVSMKELPSLVFKNLKKRAVGWVRNYWGLILILSLFNSLLFWLWLAPAGNLHWMVIRGICILVSMFGNDIYPNTDEAWEVIRVFIPTAMFVYSFIITGVYYFIRSIAVKVQK